MTPTSLSITAITFGACIAALNFYLSFLRYPVHRWSGGTKEDFRWVSEIPIIGSIALIPAILSRHHLQMVTWAAPVLLIDTGGIFWIFIWTALIWIRRTRR